MNLSEIFIRRPVMTILVMLSIVFFGFLSYFATPISDLPDVDFPTIEVSVSYPGADPRTIADTVVVPLEQQFTSIPGIRSISSTSATGYATIVLQFVLDRSIDLAATDVQAALNAANPQLPIDLPYAPTYSKVNPTSTPILFLVITSKTLKQSELYTYGNTIIGQRLSMVEGVAQVSTFGQPYAARLRVDPQKLAARGIDINTLGTTIENANVYFPTGTLFGETNEYTVDVGGQIYTAEGYNDLIIKTDKGTFTKFRDIGEAIDSIQNDKVPVRYYTSEMDQETVGLAILKQPGANTLRVIDKIKGILPSLERTIPGSIEIINIYDQSEYINESVHDVQLTFSIALLLVVCVIFVYMGKAMNTLIPSLAIPISISGTLIMMYHLGFTIDILSLLAITLSIGFLVDDAIVVLENIVRHIEQGEPPLEAALKGSKEISFTIVSMTLSLCSVFIPLLFMAGIIGRLLHEFAMTIVIALLMSGFVSISLTPLLCSRFVRIVDKTTPKNRLERFSEWFNESILSLYRPTLSWALKHRFKVLLGGIGSVVCSLFLFLSLPKDFIPNDDMGFVQVFTMTADGTSPFQVAKYQRQISEILKKSPYVEGMVTLSSNNQDNMGQIYIRLKPIRERPSIVKCVEEFYKLTANIPGTEIFYKVMPLINLQVGAQQSKGDYQYTMISIDQERLYKYALQMQERLKHMPGLSGVTTDLDINQPQLQIEILRDKASYLGITAQQIENAFNLALATSNLSPINTPQYQYYAIMEYTPYYYNQPIRLDQMWLANPSGGMVPLSTITRTKETVGPLTINHIDTLPSATISFNLDNTSLETVLTEIQKIGDEVLPSDVFGSVQGAANIFKASFANLNFLLLITFFVIYVILGILYENFFPPLTIMSTLPPAALGGLLSLALFGDSLSLYAFVGVILLLGIVMKNGIIMVDFANHSRRTSAKSAHDAIYEACLIRCRPILMTTFSALMGAVPIAIGIGGVTAQSRRPLGVAIVGGLIVSQILTLYLTPVIYTYVESLEELLRGKKLS